MVAGKDDLIGRRRGVTTDHDAQGVDAGPAREELLRNAISPIFGQPGIHQVSQNLPLVAAEPEQDVPAAAHDAAIVILPQRVVVGDASLSALLRVERGQQTLCERVHMIERAAWTRWH
jgi:hypothetical protein